MIWLGYFMAGIIMWHLNKQIYHCKINMEKILSRPDERILDISGPGHLDTDLDISVLGPGHFGTDLDSSGLGWDNIPYSIFLY